ncbi:MAG: SMC-Scp complex subunit ScpB [Armatimonadota bacterium]|nr:SMC-Scp complex subunit ScpB [Armatimonadota bacterium]
MKLIDTLEALLFVADSPVALDDLAHAAQVGKVEADEALRHLGTRMAQDGPLQLVRLAGGYQVCTKSECVDAITRFLKPQRQRLTRSALEVLAIIAYRQPITSSEIEKIRGVQSDYALRSLVEKDLIYEVDRMATPGRPILYGTTDQFLHVFNLNDLDELPELQGEPEVVEVGV